VGEVPTINEELMGAEATRGSGEVVLRLVVTRGETAGRTFVLPEGTSLVGRWDADAGAFPEIDLERDDVEAKVSRRHAVVERQGTRVTIEDAGSLNGTFINRGPRLKPGERYELKAGDEVIVGKTFLRFEAS